MTNQEEVFNLVRTNSEFINNNKNINSRWKNFVDAVYVIFTGDITDELNLNLKSQNLDDIVIYLKAPYLRDIKQNYFTSRIDLHGCHISHTLCAEHALENNYKYILILEDDCWFNKYITDDEINKLIELRNKYNPFMINLSPPEENGFSKQKEFNIVKKCSSLTHFIYLNTEGMRKILNTKTCPPPKYFLHPPKNIGTRTLKSCYFGADEFWTFFTDHYSLEVPYDTSIACQYKPNRSQNLNRNLRTNFIKYGM